MEIAKEKFVAIEYVLKDAEGTVMDTTESREPLAYVQGQGFLLKGLENALEGKKAGESVQVVLSPEDAYGLPDENLVFEVPRAEMEGVTNLRAGMQLQAHTPAGPQTFMVLDVNDVSVKVDGNHPMAGKALHFDVVVKEVRDATEEELNPSHSCCGGHGDGECGNHGHHHDEEYDESKSGAGDHCGCGCSH